MLVFTAFLEGKEKDQEADRMNYELVSTFIFLSIDAIQRNFTLVLTSKQRLHKLRFLQKLGCQKPCWDQARL